MKTYDVKLLFTNLDNTLFTDEQAEMTVEIKADNYQHAYLLAQRLSKVMDSDTFDLIEKG